MIQVYYITPDGDHQIANDVTVTPAGIIIPSPVQHGKELFIPMHRILAISANMNVISTLPL